MLLVSTRRIGGPLNTDFSAFVTKSGGAVNIESSVWSFGRWGKNALIPNCVECGMQ